MAVAVTLILTTLFAFANIDPKKGRVTANPTSGDRYSLEQEVDYGQQAIPEIEKGPAAADDGSSHLEIPGVHRSDVDFGRMRPAYDRILRSFSPR